MLGFGGPFPARASPHFDISKWGFSFRGDRAEPSLVRKMQAVLDGKVNNLHPDQPTRDIVLDLVRPLGYESMGRATCNPWNVTNHRSGTLRNRKVLLSIRLIVGHGIKSLINEQHRDAE